MSDDQPKDAQQSADDLWSTAAGFGVTPNSVKMMLAPIVQEIMKDSLSELPKTIQAMVTAQTDQLAEEIVTKVKSAITGAIGGGSVNGTGTGTDGAPVAGVNPLASALLTAVTNKIMGSPAVGPSSTAGPVQAITDYANSMSTLWGNVLEPILGIYGQGARDERSRLTDLTKMGYEVNIGGPVNQPVVETAPAAPATRTATMNQSGTMKDAARRVAEAIRVGG